MVSIFLADSSNVQRGTRRPVRPSRGLQRPKWPRTEIHLDTFEARLSASPPIQLQRLGARFSCSPEVACAAEREYPPPPTKEGSNSCCCVVRENLTNILSLDVGEIRWRLHVVHRSRRHVARRKRGVKRLSIRPPVEQPMRERLVGSLPCHGRHVGGTRMNKALTSFIL